MYHKNLDIENIKNEEWIDVIGFDGVYQVSNMGRIKTVARMVSNGKGGRWLKEKIRKQVVSSDGRLTCPLSYLNTRTSINIPAVVYFSFNPEQTYNPRKQCIMHIDKVKSNNMLSNLKIESISKSHSINFKKGLCPHLDFNRSERTRKLSLLKSKICKDCREEKDIDKFRKNSNQCKKCRSAQVCEARRKRIDKTN